MNDASPAVSGRARAPKPRRPGWRRAGAVLMLCLSAALATAQEAPEEAAETETVVVGPQYGASGFHRFFFGDDYRQLWTAPVTLEVLDLESTDGGLTPVMRVGGQQTKSLAMKGASGRDWTFRSADKDPASILPPDLQEGIAAAIVRDQIAAANPAAAVVADRLMEAAGVLHSSPRLVVMPDDPALGEFREVFAGVPGTFEEFVGLRPEALGASEILDAQEFHERLLEGPAVRPDVRALLKARLLDVFMGDWDRHREQWRWVLMPGEPRWQPVPEDRDQAFSRFEGLIPAAARDALLRFVDFGPEYPSITGVTYNGWEQDRQLLNELDGEAWREVAADLQSRLTDAVIDEAVARLPEAYRRLDGERLASDLRARRDRLPAMARRYYLHLAKRADIHATNAAERIEIEHLAGGGVEIRVAPAEPADAPAYLSRRFDPEETDEVRVYARGGDDRIATRGRRGPILIRVVGGPGNDTLDESAGGGTRFSDWQGQNRVIRGAGTRVDERRHDPPPPVPRAPWIPHRDWGTQTLKAPWLGYGNDEGAFLGFAVTRKAFGFRQLPYGSRHSFRGGYAVGARTGKVEYTGEFRAENSGRRLNLDVYASGIETLHFFGYGNETEAQGDDDFHRVQQEQLSLAPAISFPLGGNVRFSLGAVAKWSRTDDDADGFFPALDPAPYGSEDFGQLGVTGALRVDTRDRQRGARRGATFEIAGSYYPEVWSVESGFGEVHGSAAAYLSGGGYLEPTLALRAGGRRVFGDYPFHESAFLGGSLSTAERTTVRGFPQNRFAGDASAFGNAELRLRLGRVFLLLPADFGIFGLADAGRVYLEGEESDLWHHAVGGGVWLAYLDRAYTVSASVARSDEGTRVYVRAGFGF